MPELRRRARLDGRAAAVLEVEGFLQPFGARRLNIAELRTYAGHYCAGWRLSLQFSDRRRVADVLLDNAFPRVAPRLALLDRPPFLSWPHVERDGLLCLGPARAAAAEDRPVDALAATLDDGFRLVESCIRGDNEDDFRTEFTSYWAHEVTPGLAPMTSIVSPDGPTRALSAWRGRHATVVADSDKELRSWLAHRFGATARFEVERALLLWLERPLLPREYPQRATDLERLARRTSSDGWGVLEELASSGPEEIVVLLGAPSSNGACFGGVLVKAPRGPDKRARRPHRSYLGRAFRERTVRREVLVRRVFGPHRLCLVEVARANASWVHGRDADPISSRLREMSVAVVGCGSVGAHVAVALAQAGVGELALCDPERLASANVGRHPLGVADVGRRKAIALADHIRARFPHVRQVTPRPSRWEDLASQDDLSSRSLIISAVGDWATETELNAWQRANRRAPPILYGWTEAHACAGHAVVIERSAGACFRCGFTTLGTPRFEVTQWRADPRRREPACGGIFQPYGPVELGHTVSLVSELALDVLLGRARGGIHRMCAARRSLLDAVGGEWTGAWRDIAPHAEQGGCTVEREWEPDPTCTACGSFDEAA